MIAEGVGQRVREYVQGVQSGEIVACKRVKEAVRRYVSNLEKQSTADFPYHFDHRAATKACQFFPLILRHSIGEFAGRPLELEPWQAFAIWNIFGWKRDADNSRRFRKVYWSMARKNGKSTIAAGICLFLASCDADPATGKPEAVGQVFFTATKKEQAEVVYGETSRMRLQSPHIAKATEEKNETIFFKKTGTYIKKLAYDKKGFDGLNPFVIVMDELHAWSEYYGTFYDTLVTGSGSRTQPLHLIITTAGDDTSHLWLRDYNYACSVLNGDFNDDSLFALVYELDEADEPGDEANWIKSNPNLGVSCKLDYLRQRWKEDQHTAIGRNRFVRYHGNRLVSSTDKAFNLDAFDRCVGVHSDWTQADAFGAGVDLGSRDDLAAYALCARFPVEQDEQGKTVYRYEIKTRCFIAADSKRDLSVMPFSQWVFDGNIEKVRFPLEDLYARLLEELQQYGIGTVAYDPYNGQQLGEQLGKEGVVAARMAQNQINFNEPIRDFIQLMESGRLVFEDSRLLRWCAGNAIIAKDRQDRWMFDKRTSKDKIDPIVAAVMAYRIASLQPERASGSLFIG